MDLDPALMSDLRSRFGLRFQPARKVPNDQQMLNRMRVAFAHQQIRVHSSCKSLRHQLKAGIFNDRGSDYVKTELGGRLDLLQALKYGCLNLKWKEVLAPSGPMNGFMPYQSPFAKPGTSFQQGLFRRSLAFWYGYLSFQWESTRIHLSPMRRPQSDQALPFALWRLAIAS
jgi:hypothetical protein